MVFWLLLVALVPLLSVSGFTLVLHTRSIKTQSFQTLRAVRDLKVNQIRTWMDEKKGDIKTFVGDIQIHDIARLAVKTERYEAENTAIRQAYEFFDNVMQNYESYREFFIIHPKNGKIVFSTQKSNIGKDVSDRAYFRFPVKTGKLFFSEIHQLMPAGEETMVISHSIRDTHRPSADITGVLAARIDLNNSIYDLLLDRTGLGDTGETLIVNHQTVALSELRWHHRAPLKLRIDALPAVLAVQRKTGVVEAKDYRGEKVLAAYTYIPETRWGFVAKMDLDEIYAPIQYMLWNSVVVLAISLIAVYGLAVMLSHTISQPVLAMADTAKKFQKGDVAARNRKMTDDEIGFLAESFNSLADSLSRRFRVEHQVAGTKELMVGVSDLVEFRNTILNQLMEITESDFGVYYLKDFKTGRFEPYTSVGMHSDKLESFDAEAYEGQFGRVLRTLRILQIKDIPKDTVFTFKAFIGTLVPEGMIAVPVVIENQARSVILMGKISGYDEDSIEILNQVWLTLNMTFSNLLYFDEIKTMAAELGRKNEMLEAQSQELQAQTEELIQQSDQLQKQNLELERRRHQVEEMNRLKSCFLSNMSHELRTPLNSIMALSRVLIMQTKDKLAEEEYGYLAVIERNGRNLLELINSILDLSKIEAGRMEVHPSLFSAESLILEIIESLKPIAVQKNLSLQDEFPENFPDIESDKTRVQQILLNIIGNAVKFTDEGGVTISGRFDKHRIFIDVVDTGIGIAEDELPHVFEEFRQVDGSSSRKYEGTGLGLAIAYKFAKMLGGDLNVDSSPGAGSTFTLSLPIKWKGITPVVEPVPDVDDVREGADRKTVLVVDDELDAANMISGFLRENGYNTLIALSGKQALRMAREYVPFAVTLDILMPDMDGFEVLLHLKQDFKTRDIPVIIVSVSNDRATGIALGATGYVTKPVAEAALMAEIGKLGKPMPLTVMVVDDNPFERRNMSEILQNHGMQTLTAHDGNQCLSMLQESLPDLMVLDLMMPGLDGFQVLERLRMNPDTVNLPVIIVTAMDLTPADKQRLSGNVSSILAKTDRTPDTLFREIRRILKDVETVSAFRRPVEKEKKYRILVVEDNEAAVIQLKQILEVEGYGVDVARGGRAAVDYLETVKPDGVILDLMMPEVDGFQVLTKIRQNQATEDIPVLVLTAKDLTSEDFVKLRAGRIHQLVQKGDIDREGLLAKTRRMLGREKVETDVKKPETPHQRMLSTASDKFDEKVDTRPRAPAGSTASVLIIEDNPDNLISLKAVLGNRYQVLEAQDGEEGLRMAEAHIPDLVLLDMGLPGMDGVTVVRSIRTDEKLKHIPVVALTAQAMRGDKERILQAGCNDYVAKPFDPAHLLNTMEHWLK